jgi:hypothetical protein
VNAFFLLYALTISLELVLSLIMALFIFLIVAPRGTSAAVPESTPARRQLAGAAHGALADAFATISNGRDDVATIVHAQRLLERALEDAGQAPPGALNAHADA